MIKFMFWTGLFAFLWFAGILQFIMWFWAVVFMWIGSWL